MIGFVLVGTNDLNRAMCFYNEICASLGKTGFYLLANDSGASPKNIVSAEALLDDTCAN